jgi:predicted Zn-dependent peptidase
MSRAILETETTHQDIGSLSMQRNIQNVDLESVNRFIDKTVKPEMFSLVVAGDNQALYAVRAITDTTH